MYDSVLSLLKEKKREISPLEMIDLLKDFKNTASIFREIKRLNKLDLLDRIEKKENNKRRVYYSLK